jgi:hypothetical protein
MVRCHFVHHKSYMTGCGIELGLLRSGKQAINRVYCITAFRLLRCSVQRTLLVFPQDMLEIKSLNWLTCQGRLKLKKKKLNSWSESASEIYRQIDSRLLAELLPTFADRGCLVVSSTDPLCRIFDFLDRSRYFFFQVAPQLYLGG